LRRQPCRLPPETLIEGHNTTPREIVRALEDRLDTASERRNLQLEVRAHIRVQREIDPQHAAGVLLEPASAEFIRVLHRAFCDGAPPEMLVIQGRERQVTMIPGEFRTLPEHEVEVGRHLPPSAPAIEAFMAHFAQRYRLEPLGKGTRITATSSSSKNSDSSVRARRYGSEPPIFVTTRSYSGVHRSGMISLTGLRVWRQVTAQRHGSNRGAETFTVRNKDKRRRDRLSLMGPDAPHRWHRR
jgi:hypothetical protein